MKHILLLLFVVSNANILFGQNFEAKNIKFFPGEYNSYEAFHFDPQGNKFIAGQGTGEIDLDFGSESNALPETSLKDLYLVKYDANDNFNWLLSFEGTNTDNRIISMVSDNGGNIYVGGAFSESLQLTPDGLNEITSFGSQSMFVAKFDNDGNLLWQFTVGDSGSDQHPGNMFIKGDLLIIHLNFDGNFDVDPGPGTTMIDGDSNAMLVYDLNGTFSDTYSHRGGTTVHSSVMDEAGNLYLSGQFSGLVSFDFKSNASIISIGPFDAFVAKYDNDFNLIWFKRVGKSQSTLTFSQIALDSNDDLVVGGNLVPGIMIGVNETENEAKYLVNLSKEGEFTAFKEMLPKSSLIVDLKVNSDDQIILSASFTSTIDIDPTEGIYELTPEGEFNIFLAVYESDFTLLDSDQIYAEEFKNYGVFFDDTDNLFILTDFVGVGKCVLGSTDIFTAESEENFVFYTLDIEGCTPTEEQIYVEGCEDVVVNGETYTTSGDYQQVSTNAEGCDHVLFIGVTIHSSLATDTSIISCGLFIFNGEIIDASGSYNFAFTSMYGCDSTVMIALEVVEINPGITIVENELTADESEGDTYQWYDCDADMPIEGASNRTFLPESDGSYRVQIFKDVCSFFTACIPFTLVNIVEHDIEVKISPNPTNGLIYIKGNIDILSYHFKLFDLTGKVVNIANSINTGTPIDISHVRPGVYLIRLENDQKALVKKIIKF